jgi:hypothetical protein
MTGDRVDVRQLCLLSLLRVESELRSMTVASYAIAIDFGTFHHYFSTSTSAVN